MYQNKKWQLTGNVHGCYTIIEVRLLQDKEKSKILQKEDI
jgi:hypothetical protein